MSNSRELNPDLQLNTTEARAILEAEAQAKAQLFNTGMVKLSNDTGYAAVPAITMPGGEVVSVASLLKFLNFQGHPTIQIVPK